MDGTGLGVMKGSGNMVTTCTVGDCQEVLELQPCNSGRRAPGSSSGCVTWVQQDLTTLDHGRYGHARE